MEPIYFDNHLVILEKPAGIATQPDFHEMAKEWGKNFFSKKGAIFLEPIHRLDKPASGIVVFAKTTKALKRLNEAMRAGEFEKVYLAIVEGEVEEEGSLTHYLSHGSFRAHVVDEADPEGKLAHLTYRKKQTRGGKALVEVQLHTGRYHQIRAQFGEMGHPIVGDQKYGARKRQDQIPLHHHKITFSHPVTKEKLTFESQAAFSL